MALTKVTGDFIKAGSITQGHLHSSHGITTTHITEGDKLFFTNARVDSRVGSLSTSNLSEGTNLYYTDARVDARIAAASTSDLSEGTNLYYTDARADARVALIVDSAPGTLNTLNELAAALGDDANFSTTVTNSIALKAPLASPSFTGNATFAGGISVSSPGSSFYTTFKSANDYVIGLKDSANTTQWWIKAYTNGNFALHENNVGDKFTIAAGGNVTFTGTLTASGYNDSNWNTAHGWGDHASAGYLTSSTGFPKGADIGTSADLDNYTSNGYYHQNSNALAAGGSNYPSAVAGMLTVKADGVMVYQTYQGYGANSTWERKYYNGSWQSWHKQWDSGEFANNSANWNTAYSWGNHASAGYLTSYTETDTLAAVTGRGASTSSVVTLTGGSKIVVQGATDGGGSRGIFMWTNTDSNWGIYMSTPGSTNNIGGGTAPSGLNGETSHSIRFRIASNAANGFIWENHNNAALMSLRGSAGDLITSSSMRSPIFYDSNNTTYFLNPSASGGNALNTIGDWRQTTDTWSGEVSGKMQYHGNHWYIQAAGYVHFRNTSGVNTFYVDSGGVGYISNYLTGANSLRAPIFYDSDDTAYYVNPATSSLLKGVQINTTVSSAGSSLKIYTTTNHQYPQIHSNASLEAMWNYKNTAAEWYVGIRTSSQLVGTSGFHFYNTTSAQTVGGWDINGHSYSIASSRAPIFYDSNNTAYYLNPQDQSSMYGVAVRGDNASTGTGNQIFFWGSGNSTTSAIGFKANGGNFTNPTGNGDGYNTYLTMDTAGRGWVFRQGTGGSNFTSLNNSGWILNNGIWQANASMRSPVFYDSGNTNYYVDPTSTSNLSKAIFNTSSTGLPRQITIKEDGDTENSMGSYPGNWTSALNIQSNDGSTYLWFSPLTSNIPRIQTNYGQLDFYMGNNTNRALHLSGASARSEIFYDLNDTGYYVDPASKSFLSTIHFNGSVSGSGAGSEIGRNHAYDTMELKGYGAELMIGAQHAEININYRTCNGGASSHTPTTWKWRAGTSSNWSDHYMGLIQSSSSMRAPVFYDSNDTGYYMNYLGGGTLRGNFQFAANSTSTSYNDASIELRESNYTANGTATPPFIGFHWGGVVASSIAIESNGRIAIRNNPGNAYEKFIASVIYASSDVQSPIYYDSNDTAYYTDPASTSSLKLLKTGQNHQSNAPRWDTSFYVAQSQHFYAHSSTQTMYLGESNTINIRSVGIASGSLRAPLFYDSNNTAYYADPGSTSNMNAVTLVGTFSGQNGYFNQDLAVGFNSGAIGGKLNIQINSNNGIGVKNNLNGRSGVTGLLQYTSASYASSGYNMVFQAAPPSGSDTNMLLCYINGNIVNRFNSYGQYSDIKLKENIVDTTPKLEDVKRIRIRNFNFKGDPYKQIGVVAQEFEEVFPGLVEDKEVPDEEGTTKTVKYSVLVPILVKAMQEQQTIIDDLKSRLETLENQ